MKKKIPAHLMAELKRDALLGAAKICRAGCTAHESACDKPHSPYSFLPLINPEFKCPLACLDIPENTDTRKWYQLPAEETIPLDDEVFALCAICEHSDFTYDKASCEMTIERKKFETTCIDCPVWSVLEVLAEGEAEASCS